MYVVWLSFHDGWCDRWYCIRRINPKKKGREKLRAKEFRKFQKCEDLTTDFAETQQAQADVEIKIRRALSTISNHSYLNLTCSKPYDNENNWNRWQEIVCFVLHIKKSLPIVAIWAYSICVGELYVYERLLTILVLSPFEGARNVFLFSLSPFFG